MNLVPLVELFLKLIDKEYIDVDYFLTGRALLNNAIRPEIFDRDIISFFFGNGPGQAEYYIFKVIKHRVYDFQTKPFLVHNDFLKLHFDLGLFGVILYFFMMYVLYCRSNAGILMFLYTVPLFLIDNTIIFSYNILVACVAANIPDEKPALLSK